MQQQSDSPAEIAEKMLQNLSLFHEEQEKMLEGLGGEVTRIENVSCPENSPLWKSVGDLKIVSVFYIDERPRLLSIGPICRKTDGEDAIVWAFRVLN